MDDVSFLCAAGILLFCAGYILGGRHEAQYWALHADLGDLCHRSVFYRITKKIGQKDNANG